MIITVTLNPAVDQTIEVDHFAVGDTNRVAASRFDIGGKGINVARVLKDLGYEPLAMGFAPGDLGRMIEDQLMDSGIGCDFIYVAGETRTNLTILDRSSHTHTVLSGPGQPIAERDYARFTRRLSKRLRRDTWLVLAGSIPPPADPAIYVDLVRAADRHRALVAIDADGPVVRAVLEAGARPALVKLNDHELHRFHGGPAEQEDEVIEGARRIQSYGVPNVVVTRRGEPAVALTTAGDFRVFVPRVLVRSAVGAGDAFLGALLLGLKRGEGWPGALQAAAAAGSACCLTPGTQLCRAADVRRLRPQARIGHLDDARPVRAAAR